MSLGATAQTSTKPAQQSDTDAVRLEPITVSGDRNDSYAADKDGNFVENKRQQSLFISPYLIWDLGANTRLDVEPLNQDIDRPDRDKNFMQRRRTS